jgi:hypothetical protein
LFLQVETNGVRGLTGAWFGFAIIAVTPAVGPRAIHFNVTVDAATAPPNCAGGGRSVAWRTVLVATTRVVVVACGAEEGLGVGRAVYFSTVTVIPAATLRVRFVVGVVAALFTPAVRAGFVVAAARRLRIDELQIEIQLVSACVGLGVQDKAFWYRGVVMGWKV